MKKFYLIILILFFSPDLCAQKEEKKNSIWFAEGYTGFFLGDQGGIMYGGSFNYQIKKNLLTARYNRNDDFDLELVMFVLPVPVMSSSTDEFSVMYGRRRIRNKHSWSFSAGPSLSTTRFFYQGGDLETRDHSYGAAFEANIKWFPGTASKAFQPGGGLKLSGNIADTYYIGFSLVLGLGKHKVY